MSFNYSSIIDVGISPDDPLFWRLPTPSDCKTIRIIGIFLCLAAYTGFILNGSLLISFLRHKALRTPPNIFIMFMSGIGLFACCANLPLTGTSSIFCYWLYNRAGCQIEGFAAFLYGCSSCYLLCTVSLSRCYIIVRPFNAKDVTVRLRRMREKIAHGAKAELSQKRIEMERRILKSIIMTVFGFVFTWTPYTVTFFISAFSRSNYTVPPMATFICSCFAKTSVMWIPFLYMSTSTQFRLSLVDIAALDRLSATTTAAGEAPKATTAVRQTGKKSISPDNVSNDKDIVTIGK
ncbi:unnamed protein product [Rotaria sordida]|uniref:G-protein coupled receptors family 1 profile domain-containing protein n=1 Tax=Rotaria sordida TaxID=392033 RepID=A0A819FA30_9BILA|nr:unnamed protein product [Rotaria sordida]